MLVTITGKRNEEVLTTTSRQVADSFGKQHNDVLETIRGITAENSAVIAMFQETTYQAGTGKQYPMYLMTRDGFSLLA